MSFWRICWIRGELQGDAAGGRGGVQCILFEILSLFPFHTAHASQASNFFLLSNSVAIASAATASCVVLEHNNRWISGPQKRPARLSSMCYTYGMIEAKLHTRCFVLFCIFFPQKKKTTWCRSRAKYSSHEVLIFCVSCVCDLHYVLGFCFEFCSYFLCSSLHQKSWQKNYYLFA